jgi:hypothetical protein
LKLGQYDDLMHKKLESAGPAKKYNVLGASGAHGDEDEMGISGYYNFDQHAGPQLGNKENVIGATKKPPPNT